VVADSSLLWHLLVCADALTPLLLHLVLAVLCVPVLAGLLLVGLLLNKWKYAFDASLEPAAHAAPVATQLFRTHHHQPVTKLPIPVLS
jgi:hypothetical protein